MRSFFLRLALTAMLAAGLAACGGGNTSSENRQVYRARGKLLGTTASGRSLVVAHEAVPEAGMQAMVMTLRVEDPAALDGLQTGDKIAFDLVVAGALSAKNIERLPPEIPLNLPAADTTQRGTH